MADISVTDDVCQISVSGLAAVAAGHLHPPTPRPRGTAWGAEGRCEISKVWQREARKNKFGDRGLGIPRCSIRPEILGLLGPSRHRKSMISFRKIQVFGYGAPASGLETALRALTCFGWASGGVPGLILEPPGGPFGAFGRDFGHPESIRSSSFRIAPFEMFFG